MSIDLSDTALEANVKSPTCSMDAKAMSQEILDLREKLSDSEDEADSLRSEVGELRDRLSNESINATLKAEEAIAKVHEEHHDKGAWRGCLKEPCYTFTTVIA